MTELGTGALMSLAVVMGVALDEMRELVRGAFMISAVVAGDGRSVVGEAPIWLYVYFGQLMFQDEALVRIHLRR
jgi:hypothetical protein